MYYFKDHLNFTNNLQDNLYILRQRQLKEAAWSPSSGGPAVPESAAGTNELKDRMRNIKQSGDRPQSKDYLEMEAEVKRREGQGSAPATSSDPSFKPASQSSASDWRSNYDNTRAIVTQDGRTLQMDKFEGQRGNMGGSRVNLVRPAASEITRERATVQGLEGNERLVGSADTKDGRGWVDPRDRQSAEEMAKSAKEAGMSVAALDAITYGNKDDIAKLNVTGTGRPAKTQKGAASSGSLGGPDPDVQRGQYNTNDQNSDTIDFRQEVKNFSKLFKSPEEFKTGSVNDTGADAGGYGPPKPTTTSSRPYYDRGDGLAKPEVNTGISDAQRAVTDKAAGVVKDIIRGGSDWMKKQSMNSPGVRYPEVGADPDVQRGQFNTSDPDSPGYDPNADTMDFRKEVKNFSNLFKSPAEFKTGSMNDAGADAGGYGPPSDLNVDASANLNTRDPMAFAKYLNSLRQPRFSNMPKSNVGGGGPDIDTQRGQFNINDPDSPGYNPNADMVSPRKPSTEYGTDLIDQLKQAGSDTTPDQSSLKTTLQDIIDRMKNNTLPKQPFKPRVGRRARSR